MKYHCVLTAFLLLAGCGTQEPAQQTQPTSESRPTTQTVYVRVFWKDVVEFRRIVNSRYPGVDVCWILEANESEDAPTNGELRNYPNNREAVEFLRTLPCVVAVYPEPQRLTADDYHLPPVKVKKD